MKITLGLMVSYLDEQIIVSEFDTHWVPNKSGLELNHSWVNYNCRINI